MIELLFALGIFLLAFLGMAIGVLRGGRGITGSCGGLAHLPGITSDCNGACRAGGGCQRDRIETESKTQQECPSH
ncbi:hypothetical protein Thiowin_04630 [Thiorhodovibrio winogradskyi]|uniref:(Na+)-NQR maturation NqrM n=1 Tax=Thiorhodovibrio winogradskyi TaxID=77007 RepID=A0ABZ0SGR1_9GAMM|nr:Na(+)-translocating NADH-quinone reductase subunit E [Thiorhodovibrio winogradskyi]